MSDNVIKTIECIIADHGSNAAAALEKIRVAIENTKMPDFSTLKGGDTFQYKGYDWIFLGKEQGGALCITADVYKEIPFDKDNKNNWKLSSARKELLNKFLPTLDASDLLPFEMDLIADNGDTSYGKCTDLVGILSCDLYRKYRNFVPLFNEWMMTCTPWSCSPSVASYVRGVITSGVLGLSYAHYRYGCVPACIFKINHR